jgi:Domain of unknown function (DUF1844)
VSSDEPKQGPGFTIVDRRGGRDEPEAPAAQAAPPPPVLPPADFAAIALSFASSALFHLGLVENPETGEPGEVNLPLARHSIDLLELLQTKTRGNLEPDESQLLANLLTELRVRFVEAKKSG